MPNYATDLFMRTLECEKDLDRHREVSIGQFLCTVHMQWGRSLIDARILDPSGNSSFRTSADGLD